MAEYYRPERNKYVTKYRALHQKRITVDFKNEYFNEVLKPAIDKTGLPVNTFVKQAIAEKIERMNQEEE